MSTPSADSGSVVAGAGLLPPVTASVMPIAAAATTTTPPPIAAQSRSLRRRACSARCRAIRWRAFSLFLLAFDTPRTLSFALVSDNPRAG